MPKIKDYTNAEIKEFLITHRAPSVKQGQIMWYGTNKEGSTKAFSSTEIRNYINKIEKEKTEQKRKANQKLKEEEKLKLKQEKINKASPISNTKEYKAWKDMIRRCYNCSSPNYGWYGLKGIEVYKPWRDSYRNFINDVGKAPTSKHTLDRIDTNKNYQPSNVEWRTHKENCQHQTQTVLNPELVKKLKEDYNIYKNYAEVARVNNLNYYTAKDAIKGKRWNNIK